MSRLLLGVAVCSVFLHAASAYEFAKGSTWREGDACYDDGREGTCTRLPRCQDYMASGESWTLLVCGYDGSESVVCCPVRATTNSTTTPTPATTAPPPGTTETEFTPASNSFEVTFDSYVDVEWPVSSHSVTTTPLGNIHNRVGDTCHDNGRAGTCTLVHRCTGYESSGQWLELKVCGYANFEPVICCPARATTTSTTTTTTSTTTSTTPRPVVTTPPPGPNGTCAPPDYPEHGKHVVAAGPSDSVVILTVTCDPGYEVVGSNTSYCIKGIGWTGPIPFCNKLCKLNPHPSVEYKCKVSGNDGLWGFRNCHEHEPSGTVVVPECRRPNYYHAGGVLANMRCVEGAWDYIAICQPECGTPTAAGSQLVADGVQARHGELPWHAGIYRKDSRPFMQICGGSLVSTSVVISAAHCFWKNNTRLPASKFAVALGKIYRPWSDPMDTFVQRYDVSSIEISAYYMDAEANFQNDIALLSLATPVVYARHIRPVCIDFDVEFDNRQLQPGNLGKVSGWGLTSQDGSPSPILLTTHLPYVNVTRCVADVPSDFKAYITSDKICAGTVNGSAVCKGDSGGGLAFPARDARGTARYFLRGVVSTAPRTDHLCSTSSYTAFTHIQKHETFIREHLHNS